MLTNMDIIFPGGKKVEAHYKGFNIQTDQPKNNSGEGSAPTPFDLFLSSIGTCAGVYVLNFCQERNINTDNIKLTLAIDKDNETGMIGKIEIIINLPADFPEKYKQAVIKTAQLCTVKKHLQNPPVIEIKTTL